MESYSAPQIGLPQPGERHSDLGRNLGADIVNNSASYDPKSETGRLDTPFDQAFYLILIVAVGGTN